MVSSVTKALELFVKLHLEIRRRSLVVVVVVVVASFCSSGELKQGAMENVLEWKAAAGS